MSSWTGYRPWTGDVELDYVELGRRVTCAYDEDHEVGYRLYEALGRPRRSLGREVIEFQRLLTNARRRES